jgi:hypothetical protein
MLSVRHLRTAATTITVPVVFPASSSCGRHCGPAPHPLNHHVTHSVKMATSAAGAQATATPSADPSRFAAAMKTLYTTRDHKEQDEIIDAMYSPQVEFDDNLVRVHGTTAFRTQFHALPKIFKSADWAEQASAVTEVGGATVVDLTCKQARGPRVYFCSSYHALRFCSASGEFRPELTQPAVAWGHHCAHGITSD